MKINRKHWHCVRRIINRINDKLVSQMKIATVLF